MKRHIVVTISDPHGGNIYGWLNPDTLLEREDHLGKITKYNPQLTESQKYLWYKITLPALKEIKKIAGKDPISTVSLGDATQGNGHKEELVSTRMSDQKLIAMYDFIPFIELPNTKISRFVLGTGIHEFGEGSSSIEVAELLRNKFPKKDIQALYHGHADINGFTIDYSHHGPNTGGRIWLEGNEARYYLRNLMLKDLSMGKAPPRLVLRGHYHERVKEYLSIEWEGKEYESWLFVMPSMCMIGDFGRKATKSRHLITNGIIAFEIINDRLHDIHEFKNTVDIRTKEIW